MKPLHKLDAVACTLEAFADKHPGMAAREAATDARELHAQVTALVEAATIVTLKTQAGHYAPDARDMAVLDAALTPFGEHA